MGRVSVETYFLRYNGLKWIGRSKPGGLVNHRRTNLHIEARHMLGDIIALTGRPEDIQAFNLDTTSFQRDYQLPETTPLAGMPVSTHPDSVREAKVFRALLWNMVMATDDRDRARTAQVEAEREAYRARGEWLQKNQGKKNEGGAPYNPITLQYNDGLDGRRLEYDDECARFRAERRSENIYRNQNSKYNPVTGDERREIPVRARPTEQGFSLG
ncbi:hypothetical protein KIPB_000851 [Kipferlia bialata]|uniref:Uncharacterized protein n=1 Tax=Kipferlia bialata TaxID=797122 RepID=A0A9K3CPS4_9EUKA|nr:hypothetical protein KIPB_000851 [Kipferlia bialata]|eukprot:g851.t1